MKKMDAFRILSVLFIAVLALTAAPAFAGAPEHSEVDVNSSGTFLSPCGFEIQGRTTGTLKIIHWTDANGRAIERTTTVAPNLKATWSANGKSINLQVAGPGQTLITPSYQVNLFLGTNMFTIIPGTGHVLGFAGQIKALLDLNTGELLDLKIIGNPNPADWDAICAYLAP